MIAHARRDVPMKSATYRHIVAPPADGMCLADSLGEIGYGW